MINFIGKLVPLYEQTNYKYELKMDVLRSRIKKVRQERNLTNLSKAILINTLSSD